MAIRTEELRRERELEKEKKQKLRELLSKALREKQRLEGDSHKIPALSHKGVLKARFFYYNGNFPAILA